MQRQYRHFKQASFNSKAGVCCAVSLLMISSLPLSRQAAAEALKTPQAQAAQNVESISRIEALALKLGDESFELREQAMDELWKLGRVTLPTLRNVEAGGDIEASERAGELIRYISAGLLPDCPEEAKSLVLKFFQSSYDGKIIICEKLVNLHQWKQLLHLGKLDDNPKVERFIASETWPRVQSEISRAIADEDYQQVDEIMGLMGNSDLHMRARAFYYAHTDQLDKELSKAADLTGETAARWRMWLHRCSGDLKASIAECEKANKPEAADLLRVLDGNALPWLERSADRGNAIYRWGCKLQQLRLEGKDTEAKIESQKWKDIQPDQLDRLSMVRALAVNGFREQALSALKISDANAAFYFYDLAEMPKQSLKLLGIADNAKPPYVDWVGKRIEQLKEGGRDGREADMASGQVMMLSHFLYSRGEVAHATDVITPMMTLFASENKDWDKHIEMMLLSGMGSTAIDFMKQRLAQGDANQEELAKMARKILNEMQPVMRDCLWGYLAKRKGNTHQVLLDQVGLLAGLLPDPEDQAAKIHDELLLEIVEEGVVDEWNRITLIDALFQLCIIRNDLGAASRMMDSYVDEGNTLRLAQVDMQYNLLRWEQVEPALAARAKNQPSDHKNLIKWHIALQKLGQNQKAQEALGRVMRLCLGDPGYLISYGRFLYDVGYEQQAMELWVQAAMISDFSDRSLGEFFRSMTPLASHGQAYYAKGEWQKAWSINEVFARFTMCNRSAYTYKALKARYQAEFCHGMMMLNQGSTKEGMRRLEAARKMIPADGVLADDFFPALRHKIPAKIYNRWFDESYAHISEVCKDYPQSHNTHNTAAWLASRAVRHLDEAHAHAQKAIALSPNQGAYLDTMAEVWFAKGDREKALAWSEKAIAASISNAAGRPRELGQVYENYQQLNKQYQHFKNDPLPMKAR